MYLENSLLWKMKTRVGWGGEAGAWRLIAVTLSFWRLRQLHVLFRHHQAPQLLQDDFDAVGVLPLGQHCRGPRIHHSIRTAHAAHIDSCYKSYRRRCFWVLRPTFYFKAVYSVFIYCSWRPNYHACPSGERHVFVVFQAPADCAITNSFLAFFQLFQQSEIPWDFYSRACGGCHLASLSLEGRPLLHPP